MSDPEISSIKLLFFSMAGVSFALDAEQVDSMSGWHQEEGKSIHMAAHLLGFESLSGGHHNPVIIKFKDQETAYNHLLIDGLETIGEYAINIIAPVPELLAERLLKRGIWGVLKNNDRLTLLVDFALIKSS